jgi:hypothetical protein
MPQPARATVWMMLPLTEGDGVSYGLWLTVGGRWFICPETFESQADAGAAVQAVREGLR